MTRTVPLPMSWTLHVKPYRSLNFGLRMPVARTVLPPKAGRLGASRHMIHRTTAAITMALNHYAEVFCQAGLAVLLYHHRNFGMSGGEPSQQINSSYCIT